MQSIEDLARSKFGEPNRRSSSRSELRFGSKGSLAVCLTGERAGAWFDHEAQKGGYLEGLEGYERPEPHSKGSLDYSTKSADMLEKALRSRASIQASPAETYLASRAITSWPHSLFWCPAYWALFAICQNDDGDIFAGQVIYLTRDGQRREEFGARKRTFSKIRDWHRISSVRFPGRGETILAEGVETAASVWVATGRPVRAVLGTAGMRDHRVTAKRITLAEDGNKPDSPARKFMDDAALQRAQRQRVKRAIPPDGLDWNDIHQKWGADCVARGIAAARSI